MNFDKITEELNELQAQIESSKIETRFEKNKLYNYLGEDLVNTLKGYDCYIAGGLVTSLFTGNKINDVDVYFKKEEDALAFVEDMWNNGRYIASHTKKATLFQWKNDNDKDVNVQVIHFKYFKTPQDIFDTFDFTICSGAFDFETEEFFLHKDFLKHNAQRILRFNKGTDFPLMSLLRIQKYITKNYTISKSEIMRIAMTCMNLEISSYEELKDQLGGLYGESYDKMFEDLSDEEFSLEKAIDHIQNLSLSDNYFKKPKTIEFDDLYDLLSSISDLPFKYFIYENNRYRVGYNGKMKRINSSKTPENAIEISGEKLFDEIKLYKFVKRSDDTYTSFFDSNFEYKIGEIVSAKSNQGLFFNTFKDINNSTYSNEENKALIEVSVKFEDFNGIRSDHITMKRCKVLREVPEEEWKHLVR